MTRSINLEIITLTYKLKIILEKASIVEWLALPFIHMSTKPFQQGDFEGKCDQMRGPCFEWPEKILNMLGISNIILLKARHKFGEP